jgi:hypothetical protein
LADIDEALISRHNHAMSAKIDTWLAEEPRLFVAVGAAHMIGPDGLPALLRGRG